MTIVRCTIVSPYVEQRGGAELSLVHALRLGQFHSVTWSLMTPTDHSTHCPYKGDAAYFTIEADGQTAENAVWYYDDPYPAVSEIRDHVAFYANRVDAIDVGE